MASSRSSSDRREVDIVDRRTREIAALLAHHWAARAAEPPYGQRVPAL
ncbi:MAG: hypothetical protein V3V67_08475 [Myxococcota bacterium]